MKISISPKSRPGFANLFLAVSFKSDDTPSVQYITIIGIHPDGTQYTIPEALFDGANSARQAGEHAIPSPCFPAYKAEQEEKARLLEIAALYAMCDSGEGIARMLAKLDERGMLWNLDDRAASVEWASYYPLPREVQALDALREQVLSYCDKNGLDVFALYPNAHESPLYTEAEKDLVTNPEVLKQLREIADKWSNHMSDFGVPVHGAVSFLHDGIEVVNPWLSPCGRFEVDPVKTYGAVNVCGWQWEVITKEKIKTDKPN